MATTMPMRALVSEEVINAGRLSQAPATMGAAATLMTMTIATVPTTLTRRDLARTLRSRTTVAEGLMDQKQAMEAELGAAWTLLKRPQPSLLSGMRRRTVVMVMARIRKFFR